MLTRLPSIITYNLKENLAAVSECSAAFQKWPKFVKIDGKPATYGTYKTKTNDVFRGGG